MYQIIPTKKKTKIPEDLDFIFNDFKAFYEVTATLTVKFDGRFRIGVKTEIYEDIMKFINKADSYQHLSVFIYTSAELVDYISMYNIGLPVQSQIAPIDTLKEVISRESVLLDKGVIYLLYNAIEHDPDSIEDAVQLLLKEFGKQTLITEKMLSTVLVINKIVYPRQVLLAYLWMDRYRNSKLRKSIDYFGKDVVLGAMIKNLKSLLEEKARLYKTGIGSNLIKSISSRNLSLLYQLLVLNRQGVADVEILLNMYEKGLNSYDFIKK